MGLPLAGVEPSELDETRTGQRRLAVAAGAPKRMR